MLELYTTFMPWGAIIVPPGFTDPALFAAGGNSYGTSTVMGGVTDEIKAAVRFQAKRLVEFAGKIAS